MNLKEGDTVICIKDWNGFKITKIYKVKLYEGQISIVLNPEDSSGQGYCPFDISDYFRLVKKRNHLPYWMKG